MIEIHSYNPEWPQEFELLRRTLQEILGPLAQRIDHIGSTSVPGLGAKDVIDVQVTVQYLSPQIEQKLTAAGFVHRGELQRPLPSCRLRCLSCLLRPSDLRLPPQVLRATTPQRVRHPCEQEGA